MMNEYVFVDGIWGGSNYWERKEVLEKFVERYEFGLKIGKEMNKRMEDIYNNYKYALLRGVISRRNY